VCGEVKLENVVDVAVDRLPSSNKSKISRFVGSADVTTRTLQFQFQSMQYAKGLTLTCVLPPAGGDYWPYGGNPTSTSTSSTAHLRQLMKSVSRGGDHPHLVKG
jgi:hypothetical protein